MRRFDYAKTYIDRSVTKLSRWSIGLDDNGNFVGAGGIIKPLVSEDDA